jgi:hypothetical protein
MFDFFSAQFDNLFAFAFGQVVQPALYVLGLMDYWDEAYAGTETLILGMIEIALLALIVLPLVRIR